MLADHIGIPQIRDLASRSVQIRESIGISEMSRLAGMLSTDSNHPDMQLEVQIEFLNGMQGYPEICGHVKGLLVISCQRCLGPLNWPVDIDFKLVIVGDESEFDEVAEPFDALVAGDQGVQLTTIIEDELITSLPMVPMHPDFDVCGTELEAVAEIIVEPDDEETNLPFAQLGALLKGSGQSD